MTDTICYEQFDNAPITSHVFLNNHENLILATNKEEKDHTAKIYSRNDLGNHRAVVKPQQELRGHDKVITSIDVAPNTNRIVTCSQDRNAYVWSLQEGKWTPGLVLLRINRAATYVRWSPKEDKFAVASGARCVAVCYFEEESDWWASKHIKKPIRSTVLSLDWHPNNVLLATGSTDMKARVFSAYIKGVDAKPEPSGWGKKLPFATVCGEFSNGRGGWVQAVAFSPSGDRIAFAGHDATVNICSPEEKLYTVTSHSLPFRTLLWANERQIVAAGFDCAPVLIETSDDKNWRQSGSLDVGKKNQSITSSALARFKAMDSRGEETVNTKLATLHQNTITEIRAYEKDADNNVLSYSTCGLDGKVIIWKFDPSLLVQNMKDLYI